jgi:hypothetical protein
VVAAAMFRRVPSVAVTKALWPLAVLPLVGFVASLKWRATVQHQLREIDSDEKHAA